MAESVFDKPIASEAQPSPPLIDADEFKKVVETRRSVRVFTQKSIPEAITRECLRLALLAPNSSNLQPWEFYWVRSPEKKARLVEACLSQPAAATAAELIVCVARHNTWRTRNNQMLELFTNLASPAPQSAVDYYKKLVPLIYTQGHFGILGFLKRIIFNLVGIFRVVPREPFSINDMKIWAVKSCALACENLMLAFRAHGFDTCPMEGLDSRRVKKILNLSRGSTVVMAISAGERAPAGIYGPQVRFDQKLFVYEV